MVGISERAQTLSFRRDIQPARKQQTSFLTNRASPRAFRRDKIGVRLEDVVVCLQYRRIEQGRREFHVGHAISDSRVNRPQQHDFVMDHHHSYCPDVHLRRDIPSQSSGITTTKDGLSMQLPHAVGETVGHIGRETRRQVSRPVNARQRMARETRWQVVIFQSPSGCRVHPGLGALDLPESTCGESPTSERSTFHR